MVAKHICSNSLTNLNMHNGNKTIYVYASSSSKEIRVNNGEATSIVIHNGLYCNKINMGNTEDFFFILSLLLINIFSKLAKEILCHSYFHVKKKIIKKSILNASLTWPLIKERELGLVQGTVVQQSWYNDLFWL